MGLTLSMFCQLDEIVFTDCDTLMNSMDIHLFSCAKYVSYAG